MNSNIRRLARTLSVLAATAVAGVAMAAGPAAPALAESPILGTLALTPAAGGVADSPFVSAATTPAPCPAGYGQNASLRVGPVGGPYSLLNRIGSAGGYDQAPVTIAANRSLTTALGGTAPADGDYEVIINCGSADLQTYPKNFSALITVTGAGWAVRAAASTATTLHARPGHIAIAGRPVTLTAHVDATAAAGTVEFLTGSVSLGSVPVAGGVAGLTTTALPRGQQRLRAVFTPDDPRLYAPSTAEICYLVIG